MKDGPTPEAMGFGLAKVSLPWRDGEGNPETSVVLKPSGVPVKAKAKKTKAPDNVKLGFKALLDALKKDGQPPPWDGTPKTPNPDRGLSRETWRTEFHAKYKAEKPRNSDEAKRKAFDRAVNDLSKDKAVTVHADRYWPTPENGPWDELEAEKAFQELGVGW